MNELLVAPETFVPKDEDWRSMPLEYLSGTSMM